MSRQRLHTILDGFAACIRNRPAFVVGLVRRPPDGPGELYCLGGEKSSKQQQKPRSLGTKNLYNKSNSRHQAASLLSEKIPIALQGNPNQLASSAHFGLRKQLLKCVLDHAF